MPARTIEANRAHLWYGEKCKRCREPAARDNCLLQIKIVYLEEEERVEGERSAIGDDRKKGGNGDGDGDDEMNG